MSSTRSTWLGLAGEEGSWLQVVLQVLLEVDVVDGLEERVVGGDVLEGDLLEGGGEVFEVDVGLAALGDELLPERLVVLGLHGDGWDGLDDQGQVVGEQDGLEELGGEEGRGYIDPVGCEVVVEDGVVQALDGWVVLLPPELLDGLDAPSLARQTAVLEEVHVDLLHTARVDVGQQELHVAVQRDPLDELLLNRRRSTSLIRESYSTERRVRSASELDCASSFCRSWFNSRAASREVSVSYCCLSFTTSFSILL